MGWVQSLEAGLVVFFQLEPPTDVLGSEGAWVLQGVPSESYTPRVDGWVYGLAFRFGRAEPLRERKL